MNWPVIELMFVLAMAVGAVSMTAAKAKVFRPWRLWVARHSKFFGDLVACPYCTSHWASMFAVAWFQPRLTASNWPYFGPVLNTVVDLVVSIFALVALSAFWCGVIFKAHAPIPDGDQDDSNKNGVSES